MEDGVPFYQSLSLDYHTGNCDVSMIESDTCLHGVTLEAGKAAGDWREAAAIIVSWESLEG